MCPGEKITPAENHALELMVKVLQGVNTRITKEGKEGRKGGREKN